MLAGCAATDRTVSAAWFACEASAECTLVRDRDCDFVPINAQHAKAFLAATLPRRRRRRKHCSPSSVADDYLPICEAARCSAQPIRARPDPDSNPLAAALRAGAPD